MRSSRVVVAPSRRPITSFRSSPPRNRGVLEFAQDVHFQAGIEMPRTAYTAVVEIAGEQQGYVTQEDARAAGIAATTLARMAERGTLVRTSHGVYRVPL